MRFVILLFASVFFFTGAAKAENETRLFKKGCADYAAKRSTQDAFYCVSILNTALELIIIFTGKVGGGLDICIPKNSGLLTGDYVKFINRNPNLMDDNEPVSVGLIRIFHHVFPCGNR